MIIHVTGIPLNPNLGMGRIGLEWKKSFEKNNLDFLHLDLATIKYSGHPLLFGKAVRKFILSNKLRPSLILSHEPCAGFLKIDDVPLISFSHGVEERRWLIQKEYNLKKLSAKSKLLPDSIRFWSNTRGFRKADKILLSNKTDVEFLISKGLKKNKIQIFKNGYYNYLVNTNPSGNTFLFNATWLTRKGIDVLVTVFNQLLPLYANCRLRIAGSAYNKDFVLTSFNTSVHHQIDLIPSFESEGESAIYNHVLAFILPSYFEGQSLALTQAMAMGICPIVSDNSGQLDFVKHKTNGLLFKTGDAMDLLLQVQWCIENSTETLKLGKQASKSVEDLTWPKVSEEVVASCLSIIHH